MSNVKTKSARKTKSVKGAVEKRGTHANNAAFSAERPGVLASIVAMLRSSHARGGITKAGILEGLVREYPSRPAEKMKSTVSMQVPSGIRGERGYALTVTLRDGLKLFSLAPAEEKQGDTWRTTKRTDHKGAAKLMLAIKARAAQLQGTNDDDK